MNKQTIVSGGWRTGMAKDQLIFIIICSAAVAVAVVSLTVFLTSDKSLRAIRWQCISCDHEFSQKTAELPPIECRKCGGQAVQLGYRTCSECKKEVLSSRSRLNEQAQAEREASEGGIPGMQGPSPMEIQFWLKQGDGTYGWSDWIPAGSLEIRQYYVSLQCSECGADLSDSN